MINKKIDQSTWSYTVDLLDIISLYIKFLDKLVYIYIIYNPVNVEEISTSILVLEQKLITSPHKEYIASDDFNLHHESWKELEELIAYIGKLKKLLLVMQRKE